MFLLAKLRIFHEKRRRAALAVSLAAALILWGLPTVTAHGEPPSSGWSSDRSGEICIPADREILPTAPVQVSAKAAILVEAQSGHVIYEKNPDLPLPMASTTKIMTALVALEQAPLDTVIAIAPEAVGVEGSSVYLVEGEKLTLEELLYALLLASANDAAVAIAVAVGGSVEGFAELMNRKAAELGLRNTHFVNPHGLDAEGHHTTARELAAVARAALENSTFREICSTKRRAIPGGGNERGRWLVNHNKLLTAYPDCIGVKTGYTKKTGRCLVSAAERDGVTLVAVTLGAPDDWRDHTAMLDHGFARYGSVNLCHPGFFSSPLPVVSGNREYVMVESTADLTLTLPRGHGSIRCVVELPRFVFAPVQAGQEVGRLVFWEEASDGSLRELGAVPLTAVFGTEAIIYRRGPWGKLRELFS